MSDSSVPHWERYCLDELGALSTSSVDKKVQPSERSVSLINYMDVYRKDFIEPNMSLMPVTASLSEIDRFQVRKGDVLFTPSSETPDDIGHAALVLDEMPYTLHSYHTVRFRQFSPHRIQERYAGHIFKQRSFREYVARRSTGSTRYTLSLAEFGQASISVPPAEEQRFIALILDTLDTQIRQTEALIAKLERIKQGMLTDLLTRGIDQNGRLRPAPDQAPHLYKDSPLGWIPRGWGVRSVREICHLGRGRVISQGYLAEHPGPYPVYSSQTKDEGVFGRIDSFDFEGPHVTWTTDGANAGTVTYREGKFNCTNVCGTLKAINSDLYMPFLAFVLSRYASSYVSRVGNDKLMNNVMSSITVQVPHVSEQKRACEKYAHLDERMRNEYAELQKLMLEKVALMDDLLTGRVRVTPLFKAKEWATA